MPRVIHFEVMADNPEEVVSFYTQIFDWNVNKWDGPLDYWILDTGEGPGIGGGIGKADGQFKGVMNVVDVDSVDNYVARIEQAGGAIVVPKTTVPGYGDVAYAIDPGGNAFGILQAKSEPVN